MAFIYQDRLLSMDFMDEQLKFPTTYSGMVMRTSPIFFFPRLLVYSKSKLRVNSNIGCRHHISSDEVDG